jgi:hypothetical protein
MPIPKKGFFFGNKMEVSIHIDFFVGSFSTLARVAKMKKIRPSFLEEGENPSGRGKQGFLVVLV